MPRNWKLDQGARKYKICARIDCGEKFLGYGKSKYCPDCQLDSMNGRIDEPKIKDDYESD